MARFDGSRPGVEGLEGRVLLAGDVVVSVVDGDLMIRGDREPNAIVISQGVDGAYTVAGAVDEDDGLPTTVNDGASGVFAGVDDDVRIRMGRGDDRLEIDGIDVPDDYSSRDINGDDTTLIDGAVVGDRFKHFTENPNGTTRHNIRVVLNDVEVAALMFIATGHGRDWVEIVGSTFHGEHVGVTTGEGDDVMKVIDSEADGAFQIQSSDGADRVRVADVVALGVGIVTGGREDFVRILRGEYETMSVLSGFGDDLVRVAGTIVSGRDNLFTTIYGGDDLDGGDSDVFEDEGGNSMSRLRVQGFENV